MLGAFVWWLFLKIHNFCYSSYPVFRKVLLFERLRYFYLVFEMLLEISMTMSRFWFFFLSFFGRLKFCIYWIDFLLLDLHQLNKSACWYIFLAATVRFFCMVVKLLFIVWEEIFSSKILGNIIILEFRFTYVKLFFFVPNRSSLLRSQLPLSCELV